MLLNMGVFACKLSKFKQIYWGVAFFSKIYIS
ncbi:MAG: hypothetical protein RL757_1955 [Bacteroidota bacterium]|jgi:hypothetical protein